MLPNFLIIGAQRSGTTWIHRCLMEHPEVFAPAEKELDFFTLYYDRGLDYYSSFFRDAQGYSAIGEVTPHYINRVKTAERIAACLPDVKLIAIFRNPVERAFSFYSMFKDRYPNMDFRTALEYDKALIGNGLYFDLVQNYLHFFDRKQFLFLLFDDLKKNNVEFIQSIFKFLGVRDNFIPSIAGQVVNAPIFPRLQSVFYRFGMGSMIELIKATGVDKPIRMAYKRFSMQKNPRIDADLRGALGQRFQQPNADLERLIGRKLSHWR